MIEWLLEADRALGDGRLDDARKRYEQVVVTDPRNAIAMVGLARVAIARGDAATAGRLVDQALTIDPESAAARRHAAELSMSEGAGARLRILVTGGAGYVGATSVDTFLAAGHEVVILDDLSTGHASAVPPGATLRVGSYADVENTRSLLETHRIDAILHCGARSLVAESVADPARYWRANVAGGIALLDAAVESGVRRFVFSSTAAVYGMPEHTPILEDDPLVPINPYGETKAAFERALAAVGTSHGVRSVTLRYFNVAGATDRVGEHHDPETHLIPNVLLAAEGGPALPLFGDDYPTPDRTAIRDYIHVADLADAHLAALEATAPDDPRTTTPLVCNLGTSTGFSVREVIDAASDIVGRPIPHFIEARRHGDPPVLIASRKRAGERLGWRPTRSTLGEMIGSAWAWRRRHPTGYPD